MSSLTIFFRNAFYGESSEVVSSNDARPGVPRGLVGRQVANAEMLSAFLEYSTYDQYHFLVEHDSDAHSLRCLLDERLPQGKQARITRKDHSGAWIPTRGQRVFWEPQPPSAAISWARRRHGPDSMALCGITHALCSASAVAAFRDLILSPLKNFDRLICTSDAVAHTARCLVDHFSSLAAKSEHEEMIQLETIPLGIDCRRHRPATPDERQQIRNRLGIAETEDVVLFVGRLSHHAKSNPLPMYAACERAAKSTGRSVTILLAGWFASDAIKSAFQIESKRVAPNVRLIHVDAMDQQWRDSVWAAADLFISLADSVQETFGLTVVEAMSRRLPVIASDWNGYRQSVTDGKTGLLVPTAMVQGAAEQALIDMHEGNLSYDAFLGAVGQTIAVDTRAAANAIECLLTSKEKRESLAEAGFQHARRTFDWSLIMRRFERLWYEQRSLIQYLRDTPSKTVSIPAFAPRPIRPIPPIRSLFAKYPTRWIEPDHHLRGGDSKLGTIGELHRSALANHSALYRMNEEDANTLFSQLPDCESTGVSIRNLIGNELETAPTPKSTRYLDTLAWMIKFDLLQDKPTTTSRISETITISTPSSAILTFTLTCMGRLEHLKQTLPRMLAQPNCEVVVVDYSCPDRSGDWIGEHFHDQPVRVVSLPGRTHFDRSEAKNAAILSARTEWVCVIDADIVVATEFSKEILPRLIPNHFLRRLSTMRGVGGTFVAQRDALIGVGLHDPVYQDWGEEDVDLFDALRFAGYQMGTFPEEMISHLEHDNDLRTQFHETQDRRISHLTNRMYRAAKWDTARITGEVPSLERRRQMYQSIRNQVSTAVAERSSAQISLPIGRAHWANLSASGGRVIQYEINVDDDF